MRYIVIYWYGLVKLVQDYEFGSHTTLHLRNSLCPTVHQRTHTHHYLGHEEGGVVLLHNHAPLKSPWKPLIGRGLLCVVCSLTCFLWLFSSLAHLGSFPLVCLLSGFLQTDSKDRGSDFSPLPFLCLVHAPWQLAKYVCLLHTLNKLNHLFKLCQFLCLRCFLSKKQKSRTHVLGPKPRPQHYHFLMISFYFLSTKILNSILWRGKL